MVTRRRFMSMALPGLFVLSGGVAVYGYQKGSCPLSSAGYCEGPCTAYLDEDGNLICDRLQTLIGQPTATADPTDQPAALNPTQESIQTPLQDTPTTGPDTSSTSEPATSAPEDQRPTATPTSPQSAPQVRCPFGLVNDPYPGRCGRYVDENNNGICDLSEPSEDA